MALRPCLPLFRPRTSVHPPTSNVSQQRPTRCHRSRSAGRASRSTTRCCLPRKSTGPQPTPSASRRQVQHRNEKARRYTALCDSVHRHRPSGAKPTAHGPQTHRVSILSGKLADPTSKLCYRADAVPSYCTPCFRRCPWRARHAGRTQVRPMWGRHTQSSSCERR